MGITPGGPCTSLKRPTAAAATVGEAVGGPLRTSPGQAAARVAAEAGGEGRALATGAARTATIETKIMDGTAAETGGAAEAAVAAGVEAAGGAAADSDCSIHFHIIENVKTWNNGAAREALPL